MARDLCAAAVALLLILPTFAKDKEEKEDTRLNESAVVLKEILGNLAKRFHHAFR